MILKYKYFFTNVGSKKTQDWVKSSVVEVIISVKWKQRQLEGEIIEIVLLHSHTAVMYDILPSWLDVSRWGMPTMHCVKWEKVYGSFVRWAGHVMKSSAEDWRLTLRGLVPPCGKAVGVSLHPRWQIYHARPVSRTSVSGVPGGCSRRRALTDLCLCAWDRQPGENGCLHLVGALNDLASKVARGRERLAVCFDGGSYTRADLRVIHCGMEKAEPAANSLWLLTALADRVFTLEVSEQC